MSEVLGIGFTIMLVFLCTIFTELTVLTYIFNLKCVRICKIIYLYDHFKMYHILSNFKFYKFSLNNIAISHVINDFPQNSNLFL